MGKIDFSKSRKSFPNMLAPYEGRTLRSPRLSNSARINQLIKDGKLVLSLNDAVALALENNLDLAIARYNLDIADTDVLRTKAGASVRGVASGLVQGTPGGGIGGFGSGAPGAGAGGTSGGAGGAGSGAGGLVQSTIGAGAPVSSYDPQITTNFNVEHGVFPIANQVTFGVPSVQQNTANANLSFQQAFPTGTAFDFGMQNSRQTTNGRFTELVPALNSTFRFTLTQRLLSGFGLGPNLRFLRIARNNREVTDIAFRNQVIATTTQIQNIYWDLVNAVEDVKVKQRSLSLAQKTLEDDKKQVELLAIAPIEVTRDEAVVDSSNQDLIISQTNLQLQELLMKNAITRNLSDAEVASAAIVPTDTIVVPENEPVVPTQDLISEALSHRPELAESRIDMTNRQISRKAAKNNLLPSLDFVAFYGGSGLAGVPNPNLSSNAGLPVTGFGDVFSRTFNGSSPDYSVGFSLNIPLRNRVAQADQVRSELEYGQAELHLQQLQNQVGIEVRNAQFAVMQYRARVVSARKGGDVAQRTLDIEQKKLALGASTSLQVLQIGRDLAVAESNLVTATTAYAKARVELDRAIGATLVNNGISIDDAETGNVHALPHMTGITPANAQE
ncbi:MAG: TolC family protein [Acidobacteria bacterium]|nr:MAG: TolC family protein [Acidobacteriota bacterium]PYY24846.1 MAG: TolC family protein [Acidobacteriota bacterium]